VGWQAYEVGLASIGGFRRLRSRWKAVWRPKITKFSRNPEQSLKSSPGLREDCRAAAGRPYDARMLNSILIVEDQRDLAELAALHLADIATQVQICGDGQQALKRAQASPPDLVILDLGLPGLDGLEVCRRLRASPRYVPILMLTARGSDSDRVLGLELGADDYLVKPFNVMELVARAKAIVRRMEALAPGRAPADAAPIRAGGLVVDPTSRTAAVDGRPLSLTAKEFDLLLHFARHPGRVYTRAQLLDAVWGGAHDGYAHTVNSHINRLRSKLEADASNPKYLLTVWGVGYRFTDSP